MSEGPQSHPLSDHDIDWMKEVLLGVVILYFVHGIYTSLAVIAPYKLWVHRNDRKRLIAVTAVMFICSTIAMIAALLEVFIQAKLDVFVNTADCLNYVIADSVVVWRAWVVWPDSIRILTLLILCLLGTFAGTIVWCWLRNAHSDATTVLDKLCFHCTHGVQSLTNIG
ncbi:hypothetical protein C8J56DRAFT_1165123 [Mycena floridula]|nr:hypothetical protein C8J56DRAFT_1165123 [Mycena floridula]